MISEKIKEIRDKGKRGGSMRKPQLRKTKRKKEAGRMILLEITLPAPGACWLI
jgi:hypothetical protein